MLFKKTILAIAITSLSTIIGAEESNLPSAFTAPASTQFESKKPISSEERRALDEYIMDATESNLQSANKAFANGALPSMDQKSRLMEAAKGMSSPDSPSSINLYPEFGANAAGNAYDKSQQEIEAAKTDPFLNKAREIYKPKPLLEVAPGDPVTISVAAGRANRIKFNFNKLDIRTSNLDALISKEDGYMYVTPSKQEPVAIFVGEDGLPGTMVSLILLPIDTPPVMAIVNVKMTDKQKRQRQLLVAEEKQKSELAQKELDEINRQLAIGESNFAKGVDPYASRIENLFQSIAKNDIPSGYSLKLSDQIPSESKHPCDISKMEMYHETMQRLESSKEIVDIVKVTNDINGLRAMEDEYCFGPGVLAVSTFKKALLSPGQSTEVYILRDKNYIRNKSASQNRSRPSLID
ncbi:hypothetical protein EIJ81_00550 (plasmid) [Aliivibrio salmonicida]|uniref:type-F conjugative transfer system secretin TraK n=1 Tax=Aliivibrio salmonicida TaxID=40269 RepID=UPI000F7161C4|nr:type-F conjugative transfer system secretin TraK [Aliivibrio salmonicida]AZL83389.1 hypothetical protein EIJ81_00550 [Aliivibrio salmonicida]